ncbi:hypothetical protein XthCFBP4691_00200 [Xanthomonas theicola]|uniref:Pilus assembly protein n=1 Tax=Xanthomonas theicola TaxID=56464 RepID=A0A2S6ZM23_9XANT|nr:hypothetical protein XthCFBP4691_00200 [Xanthomonas theicola]
MLLLVLGVLAAGAAQAAIQVTPMSVTLAADSKGVGKFEVVSQSDATQYLKVYVRRVESPGRADEHEVDATPTNGRDLVAMPQRLVLPAGATRMVRLAAQALPEQDAVYRVYVQPVQSPDSDLPAAGDTASAGVQAKVGVSITWGVLALVKARQPSIQLELADAGKSLRNAGTSRARLETIEYCPTAAAGEQCRSVELKRNIYPGQVIALPERPASMRTWVVHYRDEDSAVMRKVLEPAAL